MCHPCCHSSFQISSRSDNMSWTTHGNCEYRRGAWLIDWMDFPQGRHEPADRATLSPALLLAHPLERNICVCLPSCCWWHTARPPILCSTSGQRMMPILLGVNKSLCHCTWRSCRETWISPCQQYSALKVGVYLGKASSSSSLAGVRGSVQEEGEQVVRKG